MPARYPAPTVAIQAVYDRAVELLLRSYPVRDSPLNLRPGMLVVTAIWLILLGVLGMAPLPELPVNDKALHFFGLGFATFLIYFIIDVPESPARRVWFVRRAPLIFTLFTAFFIGGIVSEFVQSLLPWKTFQAGDILANLLGASLALYLAVLLTRRIRRRREIDALYQPLGLGLGGRGSRSRARTRGGRRGGGGVSLGSGSDQDSAPARAGYAYEYEYEYDDDDEEDQARDAGRAEGSGGARGARAARAGAGAGGVWDHRDEDEYDTDDEGGRARGGARRDAYGFVRSVGGAGAGAGGGYNVGRDISRATATAPATAWASGDVPDAAGTGVTAAGPGQEQGGGRPAGVKAVFDLGDDEDEERGSDTRGGAVGARTRD